MFEESMENCHEKQQTISSSGRGMDRNQTAGYRKTTWMLTNLSMNTLPIGWTQFQTNQKTGNLIRIHLLRERSGTTRRHYEMYLEAMMIQALTWGHPSSQKSYLNGSQDACLNEGVMLWFIHFFPFILSYLWHRTAGPLDLACSHVICLFSCYLFDLCILASISHASTPHSHERLTRRNLCRPSLFILK